MAPRKKTNLPGRKTKKIKSKKIPVVKCKLPKRNSRHIATPKKRGRPSRADIEEQEEDEFKQWLGDEVYKQIYNAKCEFVPELPIEELYYDDREAFSSDFSEDELHELDRSDDFNDINNIDRNGLKRKISSSTESVVTRYIKSGSNHVASFIVESAIRFGQEQGVVIPEEGSKNVYQFSSPYASYFDIDDKKIRFRVPSNTFGYKDAKRAMWKRRKQKKPLHLAKSKRFVADDDTEEAIREKENFLERETIGESSSDSDYKRVLEKNKRRSRKKIRNKGKFETRDDYFSEGDFTEKDEEDGAENSDSDMVKENDAASHVEASSSYTSMGT